MYDFCFLQALHKGGEGKNRIMNVGFDSLYAALYAIGDTTLITSRFYIADFFDVLIIATLFYIVLLLFKQTRSYLILIGIGMTIVLYIVAQIFNLYLTSLALQSFFAVFLVVLVVVFQDEMRRFFELIALFGTRRRKTQPLGSSSREVNEIVQAVAHFSHEKIGALIVVHGRENIERLIEGGEVLDGVISEDLLGSIFDPHSDGHDGALIIDKNRVDRFGVHLPLSTNFQELGKHGTRHSAALGLAERSDALAIVVSEESGGIAIARDGKLKRLSSADALVRALDIFLEEKFASSEKFSWRNMIRKNMSQKILAAFFALSLWVMVGLQAGTVRRDFSLPVTYRNIPADLIIQESIPKKITVTLEGRGRNAFDQLDESSLEITVDASGLKPGFNSVRLQQSFVKRPLSLSVVTIDPPNIQLSVEKFVSASIPVKVRTLGVSPKNTVITRAEVTPQEVRVLLPEHATRPDALYTDPVDISVLQNTTLIQAHITLPGNMQFDKDEDATVAVLFTIEHK